MGCKFTCHVEDYGDFQCANETGHVGDHLIVVPKRGD